MLCFLSALGAFSIHAFPSREPIPLRDALSWTPDVSLKLGLWAGWWRVVWGSWISDPPKSYREDVCSVSWNIMLMLNQSCPALCDPMDCSPQAPLFMGFSKQEYWSGSPFPLPGDLPDHTAGDHTHTTVSPAMAGSFSTTEPPAKPSWNQGLLKCPPHTRVGLLLFSH